MASCLLGENKIRYIHICTYLVSNNPYNKTKLVQKVIRGSLVDMDRLQEMIEVKTYQIVMG
jgi:hypothetical protein